MIESLNQKIQYNGNGSQTIFTFPFRILEASHLTVITTVIATEISTTHTLNSTYSVSGTNDPSGYVTFNTAPASGVRITIKRVIPLYQRTRYIENDRFPAASHEAALDKLTMIAQQLDERIGRTLKRSETSPLPTLDFPEPGAGQFIRWNDFGTALEAVTPTATPSGTPVGANYEHLVINSSGVVDWTTQLYYLAPHYVHIKRFADDLPTAVSTISTAKVCVIVSEPVTVSNSVVVPANISLMFVAGGSLTLSPGVTISFARPTNILAHPFQPIFAADPNDITFVKGGTVHPGWWGLDPGVTDTATIFESAINSLPTGSTESDVLLIPAGTFAMTSGLDTNGRNLIIRGMGIDKTTLQLSTNGSQNHAITNSSTTKSLTVSDLTIQTASAPSTNLNMKGINFNYADGTFSDARLDIQRVKIVDMNHGIFCDGRSAGGQSFLISKALIQDCEIKIASAVSTVAECISSHGVAMLTIQRNTLDNNSVGDHVVYALRNNNVSIHANTIKNTSGSSASGVKLAAEKSLDSGVLSHWSVTDNHFENTVIACLFRITGALIIESINCSGNTKKTITTTNSSEGAVMINLLDTSQIRHLTLTNATFNAIAAICVNFQLASGSIVHHARISGCSLYNWSSTATGTYTAIATSSSGTLRLLVLDDIYADGNSNGRSIWNAGAVGASCKRLKTSNLYEINTTTPGYPIVLTDGDTTPSLALGNEFICTNSGATNVTKFDDLVRGESYRIRFTDGNTTLTDGTNLILAGNSNVTVTADDMYTLFCSDGTKAYEQSRSIN